ncbi:MAG TPA: hypothetical protein VGM82_01705 [Gemmatimonadaceae bacterium]|jgi:tetratricopeptide (TPR) repeat protein
MTSATVAYRKDLAARGSAFGPRDGDWIIVASLANHAAEYKASSADDCAEALHAAWSSAIETATSSLGAPELDRRATLEWGCAWSDADPLTLISIAMADAGAKALPMLLLDSILRVRRDTRDIAYGRALAERARMAFFAGEPELAEDLYRQVDRLGLELSSVELRARAAGGFGSLAQHRGNHPEMLRNATHSFELAEQTQIPRVRWNARYAITMSCAVFRRYDEALVHGWELFNLACGDERGEGLALNALGQLLFEMGDVEAARSAFAAVVSRKLPEKSLLTALGSLAQVSALLPDQSAAVTWAVAEVERFRHKGESPWSFASALLDCVEGLRDTGDVDRARVLRQEVLAISRAHKLHALEYRAESLRLEDTTRVPERVVVAPRGTEIVRSVRELAPQRLPRHVRLATAGA